MLWRSFIFCNNSRQEVLIPSPCASAPLRENLCLAFRPMGIAMIHDLHKPVDKSFRAEKLLVVRSTFTTSGSDRFELMAHIHYGSSEFDGTPFWHQPTASCSCDLITHPRSLRCNHWLTGNKGLAKDPARPHGIFVQMIRQQHDIRSCQ